MLIVVRSSQGPTSQIVRDNRKETSMHLHVSIPLIVTVAGGIVYCVTGHKVSELGRIAFFVGLCAVMLSIR